MTERTDDKAAVVEALVGMIQDPRLSIEYSPALLDAVRLLRRSSPSREVWRPIEEAVRNGILVLGVNVARRQLGIVVDKGNEWELLDPLSGKPLGFGFYPTHFMAVPPPPFKQAADVAAEGQGKSRLRDLEPNHRALTAKTSE